MLTCKYNQCPIADSFHWYPHISFTLLSLTKLINVRLNVDYLSGELSTLRKSLSSLQKSMEKGDEDVKNQLGTFLKVQLNSCTAPAQFYACCKTKKYENLSNIRNACGAALTYNLEFFH